MVFLTGKSLTTRFSWFSENQDLDVFRSESNPFYLHCQDFEEKIFNLKNMNSFKDLVFKDFKNLT